MNVWHVQALIWFTASALWAANGIGFRFIPFAVIAGLLFAGALAFLAHAEALRPTPADAREGV